MNNLNVIGSDSANITERTVSYADHKEILEEIIRLNTQLAIAYSGNKVIADAAIQSFANPIENDTTQAEIVLFEKTYSGESIVDLSQDIYDGFDESLSSTLSTIPKDEHGFQTGNFFISITWKP